MESRPLPFLIIDLIIQILSWLPVKSLVRFRCVSKSWNSLISQPSFVQLHFHHYSAKRTTENILITLNNKHVAPFSVSSLLQDPSSTFSDYCLRYHHTTEDFVSLDSCNGLVCLCHSYYLDHGLYFPFRALRFLFWNPATRLTSKVVPPYDCFDPNVDSEDEPNDEIHDFHYGFGYVDSTHAYGFGYDDSTHTYKLVVDFVTRSQRHRIRAYTMGCDSWRNISGLDNFPRLLGGIGRFVSGTLNWLALDDKIFSLDLRTETYKQLSLPDEEEEEENLHPRTWRYLAKLMVMKELLCFSRFTKYHVVLWQMKEFGDEKSWTRLLKIQFDDVFGSLSPVCISDNGDVVMLADRVTSEVILYNRRDNRVERTRIPIRISDLDVNDYVPSLVLPL